MAKRSSARIDYLRSLRFMGSDTEFARYENGERLGNVSKLEAGRQAARFVNDRLRRLEEAGYADSPFTRSIQKISTKNMTVREAEIALKKARILLNSPYSTPGSIHRAEKEAIRQTGGEGPMEWGYGIGEDGKEYLGFLPTGQIVRSANFYQNLDDYIDYMQTRSPNMASDRVVNMYRKFNPSGKATLDEIKSRSESYLYSSDIGDFTRGSNLPDESGNFQRTGGRG